MPDTVVEIQENAFAGNKALEIVSVSENSVLREIKSCAFARTCIEKFIAPASLRVLEQGAFYKCSRLNEVKFVEGLETLGSEMLNEESENNMGVFEESGLEKVELPQTL